MFLNHTQDNY